MSLQQFILDLDPNFTEKVPGFLEDEVTSTITNIILREAQPPQQIPPSLLSVARNEDYDTLITSTVAYFLDSGIQDALTSGYIDGENLVNTSTKYVNPGGGLAVTLLRGPVFKLIGGVLGAELILELIFKYEGYYDNNKLWGGCQNRNYVPKKLTGRIVSSKRMLQRGPTRSARDNPFPGDLYTCLADIFGEEITSKKVVPRRFRKISKILFEAMSNHSHRQYEFPYVLEDTCGTIDHTGDKYLEMATKKKDVIRFVLQVIDMVFPQNHLGTPANKAKVFHHIASFLNMKKGELIDVKCLIRGIKLDSIGWVKPRDDVKMTKPEFIRAQKMLESYIKWLLQFFVSKLVGAFFYVTEASQTNQLYFYRHELWNFIAGRFKRKYFRDHLRKRKIESSLSKGFLEEDDFMSRLKIVPKKADFRVIAVPYRGTRSESAIYWSYQKKYIRPIVKILAQVQRKDGTASPSVSDIVLRICQFKQELLASHDGTLPPLFALKFDGKNAYDSVPLPEMMRVLKRRLDNYTSEDSFTVHEYNDLADNDQVVSWKRRHRVSCKLPAMGNNSPAHIRHHYIEKGKPVVFTKKQVLTMVNKQMSRSVGIDHGVGFSRKLGLFQGFPFSGTLFNILYDSVVDKLSDQIPEEDKKETRIFRLVDDFLILSTSLSALTRLRSFVNRQVEPYNLNVNRLKTLTTETAVSFTALEINLKDLTFTKSADSYDNGVLNLPSFAKLFNRLESSFRGRLRSPIYSPLWNSESAARSNIVDLIKSNTLRVIASYPLMKGNDRLNKQSLSEFLNRQIAIIREVTGWQLEAEVAETFYTTLRSHRMY